MKKFLFSFFLLYILLSTAHAQNITGTWNGSINIQGTKLNLVFHIENDGTSYVAKMDSPDQGARGIPVTNITFANPNLKIEISNINFKYEGALKNDTLIEGTFSQFGNSMPLNLARGDVQYKRPQEPQKPYPYISEDIKFDNKTANITLAGTFTYPNNGSKFPAVVLVTGSGAQNRDEELMGHKPFLVISDYLTRKGIAVLRFDDRGVGESTGKHSEATSYDFSTDALAAVDFLKTRKEVDKSKIGIAGHSEGGMIAFMAAKDNKDIAFIVSMAGTGVRGDSIMIMQARSIPASSGLSEGMVDQNVQTTKRMLEIVEQNSNEFVQANLDSLIQAALPKEQSWLHTDAVKNNMRTSFGLFSSPWGRFFITHDPVESLKNVKCPVFAINGDKDIQVDAPVHLSAIEKALQNGGNKNVTIKSYSGLNHLFQKCNTCTLAEYGTLEETISPQVLENIALWILDTVK